MSRTPDQQTWIDAVRGWGQRMQEWAHKMAKPLVRSQRQALRADLDQAGQALLQVAEALGAQYPVMALLAWPVEGRYASADQISSDGWSADHLARGEGEALDIAVAEGTYLTPVHDARVTYAGTLGDCGLALTMEWGDGGSHYLCRYCHLSRILVGIGDYVLAGREDVAQSGNTGLSTGPHLHILLERDGVRLRLEDIWNLIR